MDSIINICLQTIFFFFLFFWWGGGGGEYLQKCVLNDMLFCIMIQFTVSEI